MMMALIKLILLQNMIIMKILRVGEISQSKEEHKKLQVFPNLLGILVFIVNLFLFLYNF